MIEQIIWPRRTDEFQSPFEEGEHQRPLRITFHSSTLDAHPSEEREAFDALYELCRLPGIEAVETAVGGMYPHLDIGTSVILSGGIPCLPIAIKYKDGHLREDRIPFPDHWRRVAAQVACQDDPNHPKALAMHQDMLLAQANYRFKQDILVTLSPRLLNHCGELRIRAVNPRKPSEAAKIIGLFLRSREHYIYHSNHWMHYCFLARHRLPSVAHCFSACVRAQAIRGDDITELGQSILTRCSRALQARDTIGEQFYLPQSHNTRDRIMYHFDYLTLLLSGAFDAEARVAHRAYRISKPDEKDARFQFKDFRKALKNNGANELYNVVLGQRFRDLHTIIRELRNTIHGGSLSTLTVQDIPVTSPEASFVNLTGATGQVVWETLKRCSSPEKWGLSEKLYGVLLEPYSFAIALVDEAFELIDAIAAAIKIDGLFPDGHPIPDLKLGSSKEESYPFSVILG